MPKYLIQASYTAEGVKGLLKLGGSSRKAAVEQMAESMGGTVEAFYYAFGDDDVFVIVDAPDDASMTAVALVVNATGAVKAKTTVLIPPETLDMAAKRFVDYHPPGESVSRVKEVRSRRNS